MEHIFISNQVMDKKNANAYCIIIGMRFGQLVVKVKVGTIKEKTLERP